MRVVSNLVFASAVVGTMVCAGIARAEPDASLTAASKAGSPEACAVVRVVAEGSFAEPERLGFSEWKGADRSYVKPEQLLRANWPKDAPSPDLADRYPRTRPSSAMRACPDLAADLRGRGAVVGDVQIRALIPQKDSLTGTMSLQVYSLSTPVLAADRQSALVDVYIGDGCRTCTRRYIVHLRRSIEGQWMIADRLWVNTVGLPVP